MTASPGRTAGRTTPALARAEPEAPNLFTRLRRDTLRALAARPFYRYTLVGRTPSDLRVRLAERWPGDAKRGTAILAGDIELAGEVWRNPEPVWFPAGAGEDWLAEWHGFGWLADVMAVGPSAREAARALVQSWLASNAAWHPVSWRSDVVATRLFAWIAHLDEITSREQDRLLRRAILSSLAAQLRHLARTASWETGGAARLRALKGLIAGSAALGHAEHRINRAVEVIERELQAQILPDGGHRSRSPSTQLDVLKDLIDIRAALRGVNLEIPPRLQEAIDRMAPILRFFRHGDRRLALFNNSIEEDGVLVDLVLTRSETRGRAPTQAPHTGFQRLQAGNSLVIVDTGRAPRHGFDDKAHAGTLSFELSQGRERIIVNCGGYRGAKPAWRRVARATAAHSVLIVDDTNSSEILSDGALGSGPSSVRCERAEEGGHQWIAVAHDGYRRRFGVVYSRQLYLGAEGDDLRGEERLIGNAGTPFAVRFHLHPAVQASLAGEGTAALLRLPSGAVWRLRAAGAEISLGESIYLGSGEPRRTQQVVLSGKTDASGATVRWAVRREPKPAEPASSHAPEPADKPAPQAGENGFRA